jgi:hypothetical protein
MIIAANKSSKEVIDDESKRFYEERFPIQCEVNWDTHTAQDYFKLLKLSLLILIRRCCFHVQIVRRDNHANFNNTPSPRIAIDITKVYINKGIDFIGNFSITANIAQIKAAAARSITSNQYPSCSKS